MMPIDLIAVVVGKLRDRFRGTAVIEPLWTPPPPDDLLTRMRVAVADLEAPLNRAAELAQEEEERATAPLLPSVDYRTNPRPVQVKAVP